MLTGMEDAMLVAHSHKLLVDCSLYKFCVNLKERDGAKLELLCGVHHISRSDSLLDTPDEKGFLGGWEGLIC